MWTFVILSEQVLELFFLLLLGFVRFPKGHEFDISSETLSVSESFDFLFLIFGVVGLLTFSIQFVICLAREPKPEPITSPSITS